MTTCYFRHSVGSARRSLQQPQLCEATSGADDIDSQKLDAQYVDDGLLQSSHGKVSRAARATQTD